MASSTKRLIDFNSEEFIQEIQDYANRNFNGNFNKAVRSLTGRAIADSKDCDEGDA